MFDQLTIVGRLGADPEMRYTPSGTPVTNFSVAVNRRFNNADGKAVESTVWYRITAWRKLAEITNQYLSKGRQVLVIGRLVAGDNGGPRVYTRNDGSAGASFEVTAQTIKFLGSAPSGSADEPAEVTEDIPF